MTMKKKALCVFSLILYLLIVCTLLSMKIEVEMQTQVEIRTVFGSRMYEHGIELPVSYLFNENGMDHLFEVQEGTGWEAGLRTREVSNQDWSLLMTEDYECVSLGGGLDYTFICTASRVPQVGELVEVIEEPEIGPDTYLVYYPDGVPAFDRLPRDMEEISRSENALVLSVEKSKFPFFEHRAVNDLDGISGSGMRVFSLTTVGEFLDQVPSLVMILLSVVFAVILWIIICFLSTRAGRRKALITVCVIGMIGTIFLIGHLLNGIDLPAAMLPDENIFSWSHYAGDFSIIFDSLEDFPNISLPF